MYLNAPIVMGLVKRFPYYRRLIIVGGVAVLSVALVASSFATKPYQLILTQGVLYAVGGCMLYMPALMLLDEWFIRRKGLALGKLWYLDHVGEPVKLTLLQVSPSQVQASEELSSR